LVYEQRSRASKGNGERIVMATDKKKISDPKAPEKKNTDAKILAFVERCENPGELESLIKNATKLGNALVAEAAFRKRSLHRERACRGRCYL